MSILKNKNHQQKGFSIIAVLLIVVVIIIAIGIWAFSGSSSVGGLSERKSAIEAASIINDGNTIQTSYDALRLKGVSYTSIVFIPGSTNVNNMLHPTNGVPPVIPAATSLGTSLEPTEGYWIYNPKNLTGSNIGYGGIGGPSDPHDPAIYLTGIKDSVCKSINKTLHKTDTIPKANAGLIGGPFFTTGTITADSTRQNPMSSINFTLNTVSGLSNWEKGCFGLQVANMSTGNHDETQNHNVYFHILEAI